MEMSNTENKHKSQRPYKEKAIYLYGLVMIKRKFYNKIGCCLLGLPHCQSRSIVPFFPKALIELNKKYNNNNKNKLITTTEKSSHRKPLT